MRISFSRGRKGAKKDNCFKSLTICDYLEKRHMEKVLTEEGKYCIFIKSVITEITEQAAVAQEVAHLIGSEEVTGSIPVGSF